MGADMPLQEISQKNNNDEILGSNLGSLCDIFIRNNEVGDYSSVQEQANKIISIIKEHLGEQDKSIKQPHEFLEKLHEAEEEALSKTQNDSEQKKIKELFKHVDMPI